MAEFPQPAKIDTLSAEPWHYRNRIRLAVDAHGNIGYRGRRSHQIIPINECPITAPSLVKAALAAAEIARATSPRISFTELALFCNADESSVLANVTIQSFTTKLRVYDTFGEEWKRRVPPLAGIEFLQPSRTDHEPSSIAHWGETSISYSAAGFDYKVENGAFFQVNRWLIDGLVHRVVENRSGEAGMGPVCRGWIICIVSLRNNSNKSSPSNPAPRPQAHLRATSQE